MCSQISGGRIKTVTDREILSDVLEITGRHSPSGECLNRVEANPSSHTRTSTTYYHGEFTRAQYTVWMVRLLEALEAFSVFQCFNAHVLDQSFGQQGWSFC